MLVIVTVQIAKARSILHQHCLPNTIYFLLMKCTNFFAIYNISKLKFLPSGKLWSNLIDEMCHWRCGAMSPEITEKWFSKMRRFVAIIPPWQYGARRNEKKEPIDPDLLNQFRHLLGNLSDMEQGFATTQSNSVPKKKNTQALVSFDWFSHVQRAVNVKTPSVSFCDSVSKDPIISK